jgi:class 3 adenylate cyclase
MPLVQVSSWLVSSEGQFGHLNEALRRGRLLISLDRRGTGGSQREVDDLSLEAQVEDVVAVADHAGLDRFDLVGWVDGSAVAVAYAKQHPQSVGKLVLNTLYSRGHDGWRPETARSLMELIRTDWPLACRMLADLVYADAPMERRIRQATAIRRSVSPQVAVRYLEFMTGFDISSFLAHVLAPTLVFINRKSGARASASQAAAARIPNSRFVILDGLGALAEEQENATLITEFLDEGRGHLRVAEPPSAAGLVTLLFTDLASSTSLTQRLGDAKGQELVREHNTIVRKALADHGGAEIKHTGDGIMASFGSASGALQCALAIQREVAGHGMDALAVKIGLNAGEPVAEEQDLFGTSVQLARRLVDHAEPGQVLASNVVRELAAGKGFLFLDTGNVTLKGFDEPVRVFAVRWREGA